MKQGTFILLSLALLVIQKSIAQTAEEIFQKGVQLEEVKGELQKAISEYKSVIEKHSTNKPVAAKALLHLGQCYEKLGNSEARKAYERIVREFADQSQVAAEARARLAALSNGSTRKEKSTMTARQVWAGTDVDVSGAPSSDGRYVAFTDWGSGDLAIRDIASGENRRLTKKGDWFQSGEFAMSPIFSPDDNQIAYCWYNKDLKFEIRMIGIDGSNPHTVFAGADVTGILVSDWSRDGKYVLTLVEKNDSTNQIVLLSVADNSVHAVKSVDWATTDQKMCFSPDGQFIAHGFHRPENSRQHGISLLSIDGTKETSIIEGPGDNVFLGWTPSGKSILFGSDRAGTMDAWLQRVKNGKPVGNPELLKKNIGDVFPMGFSKNGSFFYGVRVGMKDIYRVSIDPSGKILSQPSKLSQNYVGSNSLPTWFPDGKYLSYLSRRPGGRFRSGSSVVCILETESGLQRELIPKLSVIYGVPWGANDHSIFMTAKDSVGRDGMYEMDTRTGNITQFLSGHRGYAVFSGDGKYLYYALNDSVMGIVKRDIATGKEIHLTSSLSWSLGLSHAGDYLSYTSSHETDRPTEKSIAINIIPTSGGSPRELTRVFQQQHPSTAWSPDGKEVMFTKQNKDVNELWRVSVDDGKCEYLGVAMSGLYELRASPDGKQIAFTGGEDRFELWVMENFLANEEKSQN